LGITQQVLNLKGSRIVIGSLGDCHATRRTLVAFQKTLELLNEIDIDKNLWNFNGRAKEVFSKSVFIGVYLWLIGFNICVYLR
jgi:hypothetical protein